MQFNNIRREGMGAELHHLLEIICVLLGCLSSHCSFIRFKMLFAVQSMPLKHAVCSNAEQKLFVKCVCFQLLDDVGEIKLSHYSARGLMLFFSDGSTE